MKLYLDLLLGVKVIINWKKVKKCLTHNIILKMIKE